MNDDAPTPAKWIALEALVSLASAALFLASCLTIRVYPLDRVGQISGLASLAMRCFLFGLVFIGILAWAIRRGEVTAERATRLVCAAIAGLASGVIAGGILVALHGTPWNLNGMGGDAGVMASRATALANGEPLPPLYPPLSVYILHWWSEITGLTPNFAMKHLQILGTALYGPLAYLSWRLVMKPIWALSIGVVAMLSLVDPYKPYHTLVLVAFVPVAVYFLDTIRTVAERSTYEVVRAGVGFGVVFGIMCLVYSGWFQWSAPGLLVATLIVFPWKTEWRKGLLLLGVTGAAFFLLAGRYMIGLLGPDAKVVDNYIYFDVKVQPMYVAMWRGDAPGINGDWPPIGELGGVGLFTILLLAGFAIAIALARKTTLFITLTATMMGAWLLRFFYARGMWPNKLVQLYPRTTYLIYYCMIVLAGVAIYWLAKRLAKDHPLRGHWARVGVLSALIMFFASSGAAISDRYMPDANTEPKGVGYFAYNAHLANWWSQRKIYKAKALPWTRRNADVR